MTERTGTIEAEQALKAKQRAVWALGDYPSVAAEVIPDLGAVLVEACGVGAHHRVLDVATGSGNVALPAAVTGAAVVACDLTPELLRAGRELADGHGVRVDWREGDAEALPFADDEFDIVLSCLGVMFAPNHRTAADELVRVCRPGGKIGLINWTPDGFVGQMLAAMKPYAPPSPPGSQPPPLWGKEDHVRSLLAGRVTDIDVRRQSVTVDRFADPEAFRDYFKSRYGPTIATYRGIAHDADQVAALDRELLELARRHDMGTDSTIMEWQYLLFTARVPD